MMAQRFPLVPRTKPACRALEVRVARVRHLAHLAGQRTDEALVRAGEAHNLTALIISDCGISGLARNLCWQQFEIFRTARSLDAATAKLVCSSATEPAPLPTSCSRPCSRRSHPKRMP